MKGKEKERKGGIDKKMKVRRKERRKRRANGNTGKKGK